MPRRKRRSTPSSPRTSRRFMQLFLRADPADRVVPADLLQELVRMPASVAEESTETTRRDDQAVPPATAAVAPPAFIPSRGARLASGGQDDAAFPSCPVSRPRAEASYRKPAIGSMRVARRAGM